MVVRRGARRANETESDWHIVSGVLARKQRVATGTGFTFDIYDSQKPKARFACTPEGPTTSRVCVPSLAIRNMSPAKPARHTRDAFNLLLQLDRNRSSCLT